MFGLYYSAALNVTIVVVNEDMGCRVILPTGVKSVWMPDNEMLRKLEVNGYQKIGG